LCESPLKNKPIGFKSFYGTSDVRWFVYGTSDVRWLVYRTSDVRWFVYGTSDASKFTIIVKEKSV